MKKTLALILSALAVLVGAPAHAAVTGEWRVNLLRSNTTVQPHSAGATQEAAWAACLARIPRSAPAATGYSCQTPRYFATVTPDVTPPPPPPPPPPPTPVDCAVSAWSAWTDPAWGQCVDGSQSRTLTRSRTVTTPASNGGAACPSLTDSVTVTQSCAVDPPPPPPPPPTGSANPLYPSLDMATVPFHNAAGAYGPQLSFQTAAVPVITRNVNAATIGELQAAMSVPGTRVTITADILGGQVAVTSVTDVEVVIPNGRLLRGVAFGSYGNTTWNRIRFIKAPGDAIGGQVHRFLLTGSTANDLIIDGLQISNGNSVDPAIYPALTVGFNRGAILRSRIIGANSAFGYGGQNLLVAGNSVVHDANGTDNQGDWGFRNNSRGPSIYVDNDIRGNRFAHIRFHPANDGTPYYVFVARNTFVDRVENRSVDINDTGSSGGYPNVDGAWILNNRIYVNGGLFMLMGRNGGGATARYVRANGNVVFGATGGVNTGGAADGDASGNTYNAAPGPDPAWGPAGDPRTVNWNQ